MDRAVLEASGVSLLDLLEAFTTHYKPSRTRACSQPPQLPPESLEDSRCAKTNTGFHLLNLHARPFKFTCCPSEAARTLACAQPDPSR